MPGLSFFSGQLNKKLQPGCLGDYSKGGRGGGPRGHRLHKKLRPGCVGDYSGTHNQQSLGMKGAKAPLHPLINVTPDTFAEVQPQ